MGKLAVAPWILASLLLVGASPPQEPGEGGDPIASMGGLWRIGVKSSVFSSDGVLLKKTKVGGVAEFTDLFAEGGNATLAASTYPTGLGLVIFPDTIGLRFLDYFVLKASNATFAGRIRVNRDTLEARAFKGTASLLTAGGITVSRVRGKRIPINIPTASVFLETFEKGLGPYTETDASGAPASTLWHAEAFCAPETAIPSAMGGSAAAYNRGDEIPPVYTYETGSANGGALQGPSLSVPPKARGVVLTFDTLRMSEAGPDFDQTFVETRPLGEAAWVSVAQILNIAGCGGAPQTVTVGLSRKSLRKAVGTGFEHRFRFDTVDAAENAHLGWYVDNVEVRTIE